MSKSFSIEKAFSVCRAVFQKHIGFLIGLELFVMFFSQGLPFALKHFAGSMDHTVFLTCRTLLYVLALFLSMGQVRIALRLLDEDRGEWADMFHLDLFPKYLATAILFALILLGGPIGFSRLIRAMRDYFVHGGHLFPHAYILIYSVIGIWGLSIILVPVWLPQFFFCMYAVVDRSAGPFSALRQGSEISRGNRIQVLGLIITLAFLNLAGALA